MWDLIVSVPDHCLSFYFDITEPIATSVLCQFMTIKTFSK